MTVHKSQGSQFGTAAVVLPPPASRILTRELLYTAVTRAREASDPGRHGSGRAGRGRPARRAGLRAAALWDRPAAGESRRGPGHGCTAAAGWG